MDKNRYRFLVDQLVVKRANGGLPGAAAAVQFLREEMSKLHEKEDRWELYALMAAEYELVNDYASSAMVCAERSREFPHDPLSLASQAVSAARAGVSIREVKSLIESALELATGQDRFVRSVLRSQAEIAYHLKDAALMEQTVRLIISDGNRKRIEDIGKPQAVKQMAEALGIDAELTARL